MELALDDLQKICGADHARPARPPDAVDGVEPRFVAEPGSAEEVTEVLRLAGEAGARVVVRGGGSKLGWGAPPTGLDLVLSTVRMDAVLEHAAGDLVVRCQPGVRLADLQARLAEAGQMLALDPPEPGATVGGVVGADASGPRRLRYRTVRDLIIGVTAVLADGTVAKAGGKVVKNVAGYDLAKLYTGALGSLGVLVECIFRLHPRPEAARTVAVPVTEPDQVGAGVQAVLQSQVVPSAVELDWPLDRDGATLTVCVEGIAPGADAQAATTAELLAEAGLGRAEIAAATPGGPLAGMPWQPDELGVKLACLPSDVPAVIEAVRATVGQPAAGAAPGARLSGRAASAVLYLALPGGDAGVVAALRARLAGRPGSVVVLNAPPELKAAVDVWGPAGDSLALMRRVKEQFDPQGMLAPGRCIGGI